MPGDIAAGAIEARDEPRRDRIAATFKNNRDLGGRRLGSERRCGAARSKDDSNPLTDEISGQCRQSVIVTVGPAIFNRHVPPVDIAALAQSLPERGYKRCIRARRGAAEKADHRHPLKPQTNITY
jgi:hypothetical protein